MMSVLSGMLLFFATVAVMEGVAYVAHRCVMHVRLGWWLHERHHRERTGMFELNDFYAVIFAGPSILLLAGGVRWGWGEWATWIGAGIASYGAIYFGLYDVIGHRRVAHRIVPWSIYFKRIVQAHRIHHAVETREGTGSFGLIYAPPVEALKAAIAASGRAGVRAPKRVIASEPSET